MTSQKKLFQLPDDIHYLNCAYMSPLLTAVEEAGIAGIRRKRNPSAIKSEDFFTESEEARIQFGKMVNCKPGQVAIIPAASYGLKAAINNIPVNNGKHAITVSDEFPSVFYTISNWCSEHKKELKVVQAPGISVSRGKLWSERILESITNDTSVVVISSIHWTDGTKFDLQKIGERCKEAKALFIVDGTQSVGALPIDVTEYKIDALICAGYKWLLGPYSLGLAYYREYFNAGVPLENSWMNKLNADDFTKLTAYADSYKPEAARFNVGEYSNFILMPMLNKALEQILDWQVSSIQDYCGALIQPLVHFLNENNYWMEEDKYRANHLFGFLLPQGINRTALLQVLQENKIFVSVRGDAIRVSPHLYNTENDIGALIQTLKAIR